MRIDGYVKAALTVIAVCLVWISLGGPSLLPSAQAAATVQQAQPTADPPWLVGLARPGTDGVVSPRPLRTVSPVLPRDAVVLNARVETDGTVSNTQVVRSIDSPGVLAQDAARQWRFAPATRNGVAIPALVRLELSLR